MEYYINEINGKELPIKGKADFILKEIPNSIEISRPLIFEKDLVCVIQARHFEAAGHCFSREEMEAFKVLDGRPRRWLIVPGIENIAK